MGLKGGQRPAIGSSSQKGGKGYTSVAVPWNCAVAGQRSRRGHVTSNWIAGGRRAPVRAGDEVRRVAAAGQACPAQTLSSSAAKSSPALMGRSSASACLRVSASPDATAPEGRAGGAGTGVSTRQWTSAGRDAGSKHCCLSTAVSAAAAARQQQRQRRESRCGTSSRTAAAGADSQR